MFSKTVSERSPNIGKLIIQMGLYNQISILQINYNLYGQIEKIEYLSLVISRSTVAYFGGFGSSLT